MQGRACVCFNGAGTVGGKCGYLLAYRTVRMHHSLVYSFTPSLFIPSAVLLLWPGCRYGGFNVSLEPGFRLSALCWMLAYGGVYACANLRGGGEYGKYAAHAGRWGSAQCRAAYMCSSCPHFSF